MSLPIEHEAVRLAQIEDATYLAEVAAQRDIEQAADQKHFEALRPLVLNWFISQSDVLDAQYDSTTPYLKHYRDGQGIVTLPCGVSVVFALRSPFGIAAHTVADALTPGTAKTQALLSLEVYACRPDVDMNDYEDIARDMIDDLAELGQLILRVRRERGEDV